jgi:hypothetical protein
MSTSENLPPKKKKLKKWQWAVLIFLVFPTIVALFVGGSSTTTPEPTLTPEVLEEPEIPLNYSAEITRWEPLNPASGRAVFTIRNTGEASFIPESCTVRVQDDSYTYKGYDFVSGFSEIKPGAKFMGNVVLTVTKEGAYFITEGSVDCELKAAP